MISINKVVEEGKQTNLFNLANDALCIAVKAALGLVEKTSTKPLTEENQSEALALAVTSVLRLEVEKMDTIPVVSLDQVSWHDTQNDCWIVVYDKVYDITEFLWEHPGGEEILLEYAGRDASLAFRGVGHTQAALRGLEKYLVGILPEHERIFKNREGPLCTPPSNLSPVPVGTG